MLQTRRSLRVERYIVALIAVEIVLSLYGMFGPIRQRFTIHYI